jgi:hypothetical protein
VAQAASAWTIKKWLFYHKHRPIPGKEWFDIVRGTSGRNEPARYIPTINPRLQEELEMSFLENGTLLREQASKRTYYWNTKGVVGASALSRNGFRVNRRGFALIWKSDNALAAEKKQHGCSWSGRFKVRYTAAQSPRPSFCKREREYNGRDLVESP